MTRTQRLSRERSVVKALALPFLLLTVLLGGATAQTAPSTDGGAPPPYRISVDVDLVVLHATVTDRMGRIVPDLREDDFEVYEDGRRQSIRLFRREDIPVTVGLVVDHSGSMRQKLLEVIAAARTFVHSSNPEDEMFIVNFNENVTLGLPDSIQFTNRSEELERAISKTPPTGQTALYDAIGVALERLEAGSRDKKALIVISDGDDTASAHSRAQAVEMAKRSSAIIYTVGLFDHDDPDANPRVLNRLARATGGEAFRPVQLSAAVAICERIARDIRSQYTIGYASTNAERDGSYRAIRVFARTTNRNKVVVRTRTGYIAGGEPRPDKDNSAK